MAVCIMISSLIGKCLCHKSHTKIGVWVTYMRNIYPRAQASRLCNQVGVRVYIYICVYKKIVIERTRDLIYLKFVATDFSPKIISPGVGENSGDSA